MNDYKYVSIHYIVLLSVAMFNPPPSLQQPPDEADNACHPEWVPDEPKSIYVPPMHREAISFVQAVGSRCHDGRQCLPELGHAGANLYQK